MARVTVLLTSYNHFDFLPLAVESLRSQTFQDFETLALDDGSSDGSRAWLSAQSDLVAHLHEVNLGTYGNLNFGIERSDAPYIAVFNDDDLWAPEKLAKQVEVLDRDPDVALVHTGGHFIGPDGERVEGAPLGFPWPKTSSGNVLHELIFRNRIIASSVMFRRSLLEQTGPFDAGFWGCGDWHMWLRLASVGKVVHLDEDLTFYRVHPNQACRDEAKMIADSLRIREWVETQRETWQQADPNNSELRQALIHNLACVGTERVWLGNAAGGRAAYLQSLRLNPWRLKSALRWLASFLPPRTFRALR